MAYRKFKYLLGNVIETEIKYSGKYGAKGEKRAPKKKATPEQIKKQNLWAKIKHIRRTILLNFVKHDFWCTMKYKRGTRKPIEEIEHDVELFIDRLRAPYKRAGIPLKYMFRVEIGKRGGIHVHILIKRVPVDGDKLIQEKWREGRVNFVHLYEAGGYQDLAEYLAKDLPEEIEGQINLFDEKDKKKLTRYHASRNLDKPVPEVKEYKRRTVQKILTEGPEPTEGFYIDKSSIVQGINPHTGYSYLYYSEYRLGKVPWEGVP